MVNGNAESDKAERYDYVIIEAGSVRAVLAARLSMHPGRSCLLLDAGGEYPSWREMSQPVRHDYGTNCGHFTLVAPVVITISAPCHWYFMGETPDVMHNDKSAPDGGRNPAINRSGDVVCFGFLTYCLLLMVDELPPKNGGALVRDSVDTVGDDAAIVASVLTNWRVPTKLISSPVGNDHYGETVTGHLNSWGVDVEHRVRQGLTTPVEIGIVDDGGGRTYFQRRDHFALAALQAPSSPQLSGAGLLYVDWYDGPSVLAAMETAVSLGVPVFLNLESQYSRNPSLSDLMRYATICQVSMDEPGSSGSPVDTARSLINLGMETVLVTLGAEGCLVAQGRQAYCIKAPRVKVVDCYGAGAAFSAGIIYGSRAGWPLESSARFATAYAGLKCQVAGIAGLSATEIRGTAATLDARPLSL